MQLESEELIIPIHMDGQWDYINKRSNVDFSNELLQDTFLLPKSVKTSFIGVSAMTLSKNGISYIKTW